MKRGIFKLGIYPIVPRKMKLRIILNGESHLDRTCRERDEIGSEMHSPWAAFWFDLLTMDRSVFEFRMFSYF